MSKTEEKILSLIAEIFPRCPQQENKINESDAELINLNGGKYAINIDEYNGDEDFFSELVPETLGYNLVMATCSDLIATGAIPKFFLHSMVLQKDQTFHFRERLLKGIAEGIKSYNTYLLGGDTSTAEKWRYTAVAIGESLTQIKRSGAKEKQLLYSSGRFGAGNRQALVQMLLKQGKLEMSEDNILLASPRFENHAKFLPILARYGKMAMDSSDGLINTIHTLQENNPNVSFHLNFNQPLLDQETILLSTFTKIQAEVFLFATLGEYQIIFSIDPDQQLAFEFDCQNQGLSPLCIGYIDTGDGIHIETSNRQFKVSNERPDARELSPEIYMKHIIEMCTRYFHD